MIQDQILLVLPCKLFISPPCPLPSLVGLSVFHQCPPWISNSGRFAGLPWTNGGPAKTTRLSIGNFLHKKLPSQREGEGRGGVPPKPKSRKFKDGVSYRISGARAGRPQRRQKIVASPTPSADPS